MKHYMKKIALAIALIAIIVALGHIFISSMNSTEVIVYIDGENITCSIYGLNHDNQKVQNEICDFALNSLYDKNYNVTLLKEGIYNICISSGISNPNVKINSNLGENSYPVIFKVDGNSMIPTLKNGQTVIVNKTKDISINDIVVANTSEYGVIVKRVAGIDKNKIHLVSDNKNVDYKEIDGMVYEVKGIETWTDLSTIFGTVEIYWKCWWSYIAPSPCSPVLILITLSNG